jgi:hypothetical protein
MKTVGVARSIAPSSIDYQVIVDNDKSAGPAYNGVLTDTLYDPFGKTMYMRSWDLSTISPGDEITLTYSVAYGSSTAPGVYHNVATVTGQQNTIGNRTVTLATATGDVTFLPNGSVLGDATSTVTIATSTLAVGLSTRTATCVPLINTFMTVNTQNNSTDILKLQAFLNASRVGSFPLNGTYDAKTVAAVKQFQTTYAADILSPWGLTKPTGNVLSMTQRKINQLYCGSASIAQTNSAAATTIAVRSAARPTLAVKKPKQAAPARTAVLNGVPTSQAASANIAWDWITTMVSGTRTP